MSRTWSYVLFRPGTQPNGGMYELKKMPKKGQVNVYIEVEDIVAKLKEIKKAKGKVLVEKDRHGRRWARGRSSPLPTGASSACGRPPRRRRRRRSEPSSVQRPSHLLRRSLRPVCAAQEVKNARGSTFLLCGLSATDPRFPKYPRLPVHACTGFVPAPGAKEQAT